MENFKFEVLVTEDRQMKKLEDCIRKIPEIIECHIREYLNVILLSIKAVNIPAIDIVLNLKEHGFSLERLYEE